MVIIDEYDYVKVFSEYNDSLSASAGVLVAVPCWLMAGCRAPLSTQHVSRGKGVGCKNHAPTFSTRRGWGLWHEYTLTKKSGEMLYMLSLPHCWQLCNEATNITEGSV